MNRFFLLKNLLLFLILGSFILIGCGGTGGDGGAVDDGDDDNPVAVGWALTNGPLGGNINQILVSPDNFLREMEKIYIAGPGSIFYTTNSGTSWTSKKNNLPSGEVQSISFITQNIIFVGIKNKGVYLTKNGGATWNSANSAAFNPDKKDFQALLAIEETLYYIGVNDTDSTKFYRIELVNDWEATDLTMTYDPQPKKIYAIVARQRSPRQHFYVATDVDVFLTLNAGQTWRDKNDWIPGNLGQEQGQGIYEKLGGRAQVYSLALLQSSDTALPFNNEILYAGIQDNFPADDNSNKLLWRFNGKVWANKLLWDIAFKGDRLVSIAVGKVEEDAVQKERLYAAFLNKGLYMLKDASAETPEKVEKNTLAAVPVGIPIPAPSATCLAVGFGQGERAEDIIYRGNPVYGILYENDGEGFAQKETNLRNCVVNALLIHSTTDFSIAGTGSGIYTKAANSETWTRSIASIKGNISQYIGLIGSTDLANLLAVTLAKAYTSSNSGEAWTEAYAEFENKTLSALAGNTTNAWVGTSDAFVWHRDNTNVWTKIQAPPAQKIHYLAYAANQGANGTLYAGSNLGIFSNSNAINAAQAWDTAINEGIAQEVTCVAVNNTGTRLLAGVLDVGPYYYDQTRAQWVKRDTGLTNDAKKIYAIAINGNEVFIGTDDGIWYNQDITDNTKRWEARNYRLGDKRVRTIVIHPADADVMYIGTDGGGVYKTITAGQ